MDKCTVSLCMIIKNEEKFLDKCLKSVMGKVDEVIIVDTGSTDSSIKIAEGYGAELFYYEWDDNFANARNYSISKATKEYILVLDADEYLDPNMDLQKELQAQCDYYICRIKNNGSDGTAFSHEAIRVFRNGLNLRYCGRIHEHLDVGKAVFVKNHINVPIHHDGYRFDIIEERYKDERNNRLQLLEVRENPTGYSYYNLGKSYKSLGNYSKAIDAFKKSYSMSKDDVILNDLLYHMIDCLRLSGRYNDGLKVAQEAVNIFPGHTDLYYVKGCTYENSGYYKEAEMDFKKCLEMGEAKKGSTREGVGGYLAHYQLAKLNEGQGDRTQAVEYVIRSLQGNKKVGINLFMEIILKSSIPEKDVMGILSSIYDFKDRKDYLNILYACYAVRHPILTNFVNENMDELTNIYAAACQLNRRYTEARNIWLNVDIRKENIPDIITLCIVLADTDLLQNMKQAANLNSSDWKVLCSLVKGEDFKKSSISSQLEDYIMGVLYNLIVTKELEVFERVVTAVSDISSNIQYRICKLLIEFRFTDVSIDMLLSFMGKKIPDFSIIKLLADACYLKGYYKDALIYYMKSLKYKNEYNILYRIYKIYEILNDAEGMELTLKQVDSLYPYSCLAN